MGEILYAGAIHTREQSKVDAARITQKSGNERRGAQSDLQRFSASLSNRRAMDAAGKNINAISENIGRNLDAGTYGTFESRVSAAEQLGAHASEAAAAGVGGAGVEGYNATMRLSHDMQEEQQLRALNSDNITASASKGNTLIDATASLDNNVYRADLDFTQYVDHHKMGLFQRVSTLATAAAATYFGGPQAGMAVIGLGEAQQEAANGDYASANQSMMGAIQNGIGGFKAYRAGAGNGQVGSPVGKGTWDSAKAIFNSIKIH